MFLPVLSLFQSDGQLTVPISQRYASLLTSEFTINDCIQYPNYSQSLCVRFISLHTQVWLLIKGPPN